MAKRGRSGKPAKDNNSKGAAPAIWSKLSPEQIAVIAGLLVNALEVESVLIDRDQTLQIVLSGSLRKRTRIDKLLEELNDATVGEVLDAFRAMIK